MSPNVMMDKQLHGNNADLRGVYIEGALKTDSGILYQMEMEWGENNS